MNRDAPRWTLPVAALTSTAVYLATSARAVLGGDNGEFATLFAEGGVAHPSGYPLYTLWLRAWSWMPAASPAHGAALATALHGGLSGAALLFAARAWGASRMGALFAWAAWSFASLPWRLATHAEVFSLNVALALTIAALAAPGAPVKGTRRVALLGLAAGAALANHLSSSLLAPLGLWGVYTGLRESEHRVKSALAGVAALLPGLLTYLSLMFVARHAGDRLVWGETGTLHGLVWHVLRKDFGTLSLAANGRPPDGLAAVWFLVKRASVDLRVAPVVLGLVGFFALPDEENNGAHTRARALYGATLALAGPIFMARFNIEMTGIGATVVERFHLLPEALLSVMAARGFDHLADRAPLGLRVQGVLVGTVALVGFALALPEVRDDHRDTVEVYLRDTLHSAPPNAVLLGTGDHRTLGIPYVQRALGERRDVLFINPQLLSLGHYRRRVERALGRRLPFPEGSSVSTVAVAETALSLGRPVLLTDVFSAGIPRALPTYPFGTMIRVLPRGERVPPPDAILGANDALYARFALRPARVPLPPWQSDAQTTYARTWSTLADLADHARRPDVAAPLRARAQLYQPAEEP